MKANELRVLNWVIVEANIYPEPTYLEVQISAKNIYDFELNPYLFQPIPLTEEWLVKFGFENVNPNYPNKKIYRKKEECIKYDLKHKFFYWAIYGTNDKYKIKYVHQLQNLYFALTGEELQCKEI